MINLHFPVLAPPPSVPLFRELHHFRQSLKTEEHVQNLLPYTSKKRTVWVYRMIFIFIAMIFFALAFFLLKGSPYSLYLHYIPNLWLIQTLLGGLSICIGFAALGLAALLKPQQEAMRHLLILAKRKLSRQYTLSASAYGLTLPFSRSAQDFRSLKVAYQHHLDMLDLMKEEAAGILSRIAQAHSLSTALKETLFNQALLEFHLKSERLVHTFLKG